MEEKLKKRLGQVWGGIIERVETTWSLLGETRRTLARCLLAHLLNP